jgi:hypothetical protein
MSTPKPTLRTAFKPIQPTKPVTIAPPIQSTVTSKSASVTKAPSTKGSAPSGPKQIVDIALYLEITRRDDRDNYGWSFFNRGVNGRAITVVLNSAVWLTDASLAKANRRLTAFLVASLLIERLRRSDSRTPVHDVWEWLKRELVAEVGIYPENAWLAIRLVQRPWFIDPIAKLAIYGLKPITDFRHVITTIKASLPEAAADQPWQPFVNRKQPPN